MEIQPNLERAIHKLVDEFLLEPYRFFTDAGAPLNIKVKGKEGFPTPLIHEEYPTFFRFDDAYPAECSPFHQPMRRALGTG